MTFLAPWFLVGLVSVAIPLVLHLRRSQRAQKMVFSTTQFFDERFIRSARRARVQDLLLMMLRMALLAFFVLALAQPLIRTAGLARVLSMGDGRRLVAIVLDDSASMAVPSSRGVLFERARTGALSVINELSASHGDRATVVLAGQRETGSKVLFAEPTGDLEAVCQAIREVPLTDLATDLVGAIQAGREALGAAEASAGEATRGRREIYVFSDFQETALPAGQFLTEGTRCGLLLVATRPEERTAADLSVDAIQYGAARPMVGVPFTFRVLLTNHGPVPRAAIASLVIANQTVGEKEVQLPAGRCRIVRFTHRFPDPGWHGGHVEVGSGEDGAAEALLADSRRHFALHVEDRLRILAINGAPSQLPARDELFFLRLALNVRPDETASPAGEQTAGAPIAVDEVTADQVTFTRLRGFPLVVMANVADLSPQALDALEQYVDQGGSLMVALGDRVNAGAYNTWVGEHRLHGGLLPGRLGRLLTAQAEESVPLGGEVEGAGFIAAIDEKHPVLAGFGTGSLGSLASVRFTSRYEIEPDKGEVLMRGPSGMALLLERSFGQGRVMLFAATLDRDWTDFPLQPTYVPWLYRIASYLGQEQAGRANFVRTGEVVSLPASTTEPHQLQVDKPDGTVGYGGPDLRDSSATTASAFTETEHAGLYAVRSAGQPDTAPARFLFAANVPPEESGRRYLEREELLTIAAPDVPLAYVDEPESVAEAGTLVRHGYGVWDLLLCVALLAALVEPWVANRLSKRRAARAADAMDRRDLLPAEQRPSAPSQRETTADEVSVRA